MANSSGIRQKVTHTACHPPSPIISIQKKLSSHWLKKIIREFSREKSHNSFDFFFNNNNLKRTNDYQERHKRKSNVTRHKNKTGDSKGELNDWLIEWSLLCIAILCSRADSQHSCCVWFRVSDCGILWLVLNIPFGGWYNKGKDIENKLQWILIDL